MCQNLGGFCSEVKTDQFCPPRLGFSHSLSLVLWVLVLQILDTVVVLPQDLCMCVCPGPPSQPYLKLRSHFAWSALRCQALGFLW